MIRDGGCLSWWLLGSNSLLEEVDASGTGEFEETNGWRTSDQLMRQVSTFNLGGKFVRQPYSNPCSIRSAIACPSDNPESLDM
jgi:hypothetical protein